MKLLKKITAEPRQVKRGQPFKIKVTPNNIPDKEIYVQINGRWGTQQILQFDGLPGERVVLIRAYTDDKRVFEDRKVKITVLPEEQPGSKGIILPEIHPQVPATLRLTFLRPLAQTVPNNGFYEWFINGQKVTTQATTEGFIDLNSQMNHRQMFTEFEAKLIERKEDGTILAKYSQYVYLASPYHMIKKQAGILIPPVENDFLLNVIRAGYIYYNFSIQNVEDYSLSFKTVQFEFLNNNPDAINVFQQEDMSEPFVVPASGKKQYDGVLKANKLPADTGGFIIRLIGVSDTGIPVKSVAHFEFALQMRNETFKVDRVEINRWLWQERPWEMVIRGIAKEYFVNNRAVQNGTANISHLKRLFSMHIEGVKRSLNTVKTAAPAIAGVEITDTKVNAAINQISTPATTPNIAASQQLYQTVIRLRTFARTATGAPGRHATVPDNDADALSQESLDALRDFNLESLVPGSVFDAVSARTMEGMECQPDEDAPAENLICQLTDEVKNVTIPAKIVNARKGDIILAPGGPGGFVGGLLQALTPPQWYSHCGIMEQSYYRIYHCTGSEEWLQDHSIGEDLPLDGENTLPMFGFDPEAMQYLWPGTVSQTVQEAFGGSWMKESEALIDVLGVKIPYKEYKIESFSLQSILPDTDHPFIDAENNGYTWDRGQISFPPLVVTVPPDEEVKNPELRQILRRVADQCLKIKGYYSFYAYSDADIAFKPSWFAPVRPGWWASGSRPVVCSTLIWAAIRELFAGRGILEGKNEIVSEQDLETEDRFRKIKVNIDGQEKEITVNMGAMVDNIDHPGEHITKDGLYFYTEEERKQAAKFLHDQIIGKLHEKYDKSFLDLGWTIDAFTGMAENIANQMCNTFANGQPSITSKKWQSPGVGRSVSPDNIRDFWDRPVILPDGSLHGLYGHYEPMIYRPGRIEQMRVSRWKKKPTTKGKIIVKVWYNNTPVEGATLHIPSIVDALGKPPQTNAAGIFETELYTGSYRINAEKTINNQAVAAVFFLDQLQAGEVRHIDMHLSVTKRTLYYFAHAEINDYEPGFWEDDERVGRHWGTAAAPLTDNFDAAYPHVKVYKVWEEKMGGEIRLNVPFEFSIRSDLHIVVRFRAFFYEGATENTDDLDGSTDWIQMVIPPNNNEYTIFPPLGQEDLEVKNTDENEPSDYAKMRFWFKNSVSLY